MIRGRDDMYARMLAIVGCFFLGGASCMMTGVRIPMSSTRDGSETIDITARETTSERLPPSIRDDPSIT